jgi:biopolymer transport protein TolR
VARRTALSQRRQISELNMTPLIDLTFLLLITFIITFPLIEQGIHVRLPKGKTSDLDQTQSTFAVSLNEKGELFFDDIPTGEEQLAAELKAKAEADPDVTILVRADERIAYGKVAAILRMMHDANISRMALVTDPAK